MNCKNTPLRQRIKSLSLMKNILNDCQELRLETQSFHTHISRIEWDKDQTYINIERKADSDFKDYRNMRIKDIRINLVQVIETQSQSNQICQERRNIIRQKSNTLPKESTYAKQEEIGKDADANQALFDIIEKIYRVSELIFMNKYVVIQDRFPLCSIYYKGSKSQIYNTVDLAKQHENIIIQMTQDQYLPTWKYLKKLNQYQCSPQIHQLGQTEINGQKFYFAVMNKIGPSIKLCFKLLQNKFSSRTIALIAIKMISQIQIIHQNNLIHRKLKLSTIIANNISEIFLTNFENAAKHQTVAVNNKSVFQTIHKYSSIAEHLNQSSFPKDDLESIGYILIQLLTNGSFLYCRSQNAKKQDKHRYYLELKQRLIADKYLKQFPECFIYFMNTVKNLNPTEQPPYESLKQQFIYYLSQCELNFQFDWICIFNQIQQSNETSPYNVNSAKDFDHYSPRVRNSSFQSTPPLNQNSSKQRIKKLKQKISIMLPPILEIRESLQRDQVSSSSGNVSEDEITHNSLPQF